jgi:hypothetical protein
VNQRDDILENANAAIARLENIRRAIAVAARQSRHPTDARSLEQAASDCTFTLVNLQIVKTIAEGATFQQPSLPLLGP